MARMVNDQRALGNARMRSRWEGTKEARGRRAMQVGRYEQSMEKGLRKQEKGQHRLHATMHLNLEGDPLTNSVITGAFPQSYHSNPSPNSFNFPTPTRGSKRLIFANSDTMKATIYVWGCLALSLACNALPVSRREGMVNHLATRIQPYADRRQASSHEQSQ